MRSGGRGATALLDTGHPALRAFVDAAVGSAEIYFAGVSASYVPDQSIVRLDKTISVMPMPMSAPMVPPGGAGDHFVALIEDLGPHAPIDMTVEACAGYTLWVAQTTPDLSTL
jgi:hypothetical protein